MARVVALVAATAIVLAASSSAQAADSVTMFSGPGESIGEGQQRVYAAPTDSISVEGDRDGLVVVARGGPADERFGLEFAPARGAQLAAGVYVRAQRSPVRVSGRPGLEVSGEGRGCSAVTGQFEVKDLAVVAGVIERLWILYEQHCEDAPVALHGEVRIGQPDPPALRIAPRAVRWPALERGQLSGVVPVTVRAVDATTVRGVTIGGGNAASFAVAEEDCSGRVLAAGAACQVRVRFAALRTGPARGTLRVASTDGAADVALEGFAHGGSTDVSISGDPGEVLSGGKTYDFDASTASITARGTRQRIEVRSVAPAQTWIATFDAPDGRLLLPGSFALAARYPLNGHFPGLEVVTASTGCNTLTGEFTITSATYTEPGDLLTFDARFEQRCDEGMGTALRGRLRWRAGDQTPLPPWLGGPPLGPLQPHPADAAPPAPPDHDPATPVGSGAAQTAPAAPNGGLSSATRARTPVVVRRPRLGAVRGGLRMTRTGVVRLPLSCLGSTVSCRGTIRITGPGERTLARTSAQLPAGARRRAIVRLGPAARRLVTRRRSLRVTIRGIAQGSATAIVRSRERR